MKNKNGLLILGGSFAVLALSGYIFRKQIKTQFFSKAKDPDKINFINRILPSAKAIGNKLGIPPLFILAQLALESAWGKSTLTSKYNNYGGIKAVGNQPSVKMETTECKNGFCYKVKKDFAIYPNTYEGLLAQSKIYQNKYFRQHLNKTTDPITYAKLMQSGRIRYATAKNYPQAIQSTLNEIKRLKAV